MADLLSGETVVSIGAAIEKVGYSLVAIFGLLYVLRWLSNAHLKALNERISTLESVILVRDKQIEEAQKARMEEAQTHAHELKDVAIRLANEMRDNRAFAREQHTVLVRLLDQLEHRPCMRDFEPHPSVTSGTRRTPSSSELPAVPETDRHHRHG